jgi:hypothetical protein
MTYRNTLLYSGAVLAGLLGTTVSASATLLTSLQTDTFHFSNLNSSTSLLFDGFDSSLGTLTSVHMTLSETATVNDTALVFPTGSGSQSIGSPTPLFASATVTVTGAAGLTANASVATPGFTGTVLDDSINHIIGSVTGTGTGFSDLASPPTSLTGYVGGASSVSLLVGELGSQGGSVPSTVLTGNNGSADVIVTLQYDYTVAAPDTPVSEPASLMLLGASLLGLTVVRGRRHG